MPFKIQDESRKLFVISILENLQFLEKYSQRISHNIQISFKKWIPNQFH